MGAEFKSTVLVGSSGSPLPAALHESGLVEIKALASYISTQHTVQMRISSQLNELRKQAASRRAQNSRGNIPHPSPAISEVASEADSELHSHAGSRISRRSHLLDVATAKSEISALTAMSDLEELLQADIKSEKHSTHGSEIGVRNDNLKDNLAQFHNFCKVSLKSCRVLIL